MPNDPRTVQLLARTDSERVGRVARMVERRLIFAASVEPRRRKELHAAEIAVPRIRVPGALMLVDADGAGEPPARRMPDRACER